MYTSEHFQRSKPNKQTSRALKCSTGAYLHSFTPIIWPTAGWWVREEKEIGLSVHNSPGIWLKRLHGIRWNMGHFMFTGAHGTEAFIKAHHQGSDLIGCWTVKTLISPELSNSTTNLTLLLVSGAMLLTATHIHFVQSIQSGHDQWLRAL